MNSLMPVEVWPKRTASMHSTLNVEVQDRRARLTSDWQDKQSAES